MSRVGGRPTIRTHTVRTVVVAVASPANDWDSRENEFIAVPADDTLLDGVATDNTIGDLGVAEESPIDGSKPSERPDSVTVCQPPADRRHEHRPE